MKCAKKIISVALVLMLALSAMVLPTSAAEPVIKADVVAEYQGQTSGGYDYYKFSVYLDSTLSLSTYQLNITWDNAVWQMLRATNFADQNAFIATCALTKTIPITLCIKPAMPMQLMAAVTGITAGPMADMF